MRYRPLYPDQKIRQLASQQLPTKRKSTAALQQQQKAAKIDHLNKAISDTLSLTWTFPLVFGVHVHAGAAKRMSAREGDRLHSH